MALPKAKWGVAYTFEVPVIKRGVVDFAVSADWTPASGDSKVSKDGGNVANTTNLPAILGGTGAALWQQTLTATEMQCTSRVEVQWVDSATKAVEDQCIVIEMDYGIRSNTAQAGASTTITLDASASATDDFYRGEYVEIISGTGVGQIRRIASYNGTSKVATVNRAWATNPDSTSIFRIGNIHGGEVDATHFNGTSLTPRDIGASVLLSPGTGTGQVNISGGKVPATIAAGDIATDAIDANALKTDAVTEIQNGLATATNLAAAKTVIDTINSIVGSGTYGNQAIKTAVDAVNTAVGNLNNLAALANLRGPSVMEIPDSGTIVYKFLLTVFDQEGKLVALDASPTITAANAAGTDRSSKLSSVTNPATGQYEFTYTVSSTDLEESVVIKSNGAISSETRFAAISCSVVNYDSLTIINSILTNVNALVTTIGTPAAASVSADIAATKAQVDTAVSQTTASAIRGYLGLGSANLDTQLNSIYTAMATAVNLTALAAKFSGITSLAEWLGLIATRKTGNTTARTELNATGAGSGTYSETTDSLEAIRDRGDAAWGGGGGGTIVASLALPKAQAREVLQDNDLICQIGSTLRFSFTGVDALGDISGRTGLIFTAKTSKGVADASATIQITEAGGLTKLNGTATTSAWGVLSVTDATLGEVDITLYAAATASLAAARGLVWDIKELLGSSPADAVTLTEGVLNVETSVTRATS